jgi:predicted transcriptional regulator
MPDQQPSSVALLSIHPQYAESILDGRKRVEFRKSGFTRNVRHVIIYSTQPVGAVVGIFETEEIVSKKPEDLWEEFAPVGGIDRSDFHNYYKGRNIGFSIKIKRARRLSHPVSLETLRVKRPPQNFNYIDWELFEALTKDDGPARVESR